MFNTGKQHTLMHPRGADMVNSDYRIDIFFAARTVNFVKEYTESLYHI